jgi:hypothetical protein
MDKPNEYNEIENWLNSMQPLPNDAQGKTQRRDMIFPAKDVVEKLNKLMEYFASTDRDFTITDDGKFIRVTTLKGFKSIITE